MKNQSDTIYALSSGAGIAGVAVIRLSGTESLHIVQKMMGKGANRLTKAQARQAVLANLYDPQSDLLLDQALLLFFPNPQSFTGEDCVEIQCHGSRAVIESIFAALNNIGIRPAEAGEFTKRAFTNGKMDLAQAEALGDLLEAETAAQQQQALGQLSGKLSAYALSWRQDLLGILAPIEAAIDFPDEEDIPAQIEATALPVINRLESNLSQFLKESDKARRVRKGITIAILGAPNVGKSSLMNYLAEENRAIVSDIAGTTRDVIETRLHIAGIPVTLMDTAGIRETEDEIEKLGVGLAKEKASEADLRIAMIDVSRETIQNDTDEISALLQEGDFLISNKIDHEKHHHMKLKNQDIQHINISIKNETGLDDLLHTLETRIKDLTSTAMDAGLTRSRHVFAVQTALDGLSRAKDMVLIQPELGAEDLRHVIHALSQITGEIDVEEVLGEIFSSFCIGK